MLDLIDINHEIDLLQSSIDVNDFSSVLGVVGNDFPFYWWLSTKLLS